VTMKRFLTYNVAIVVGIAPIAKMVVWVIV